MRTKTTGGKPVNIPKIGKAHLATQLPEELATKARYGGGLTNLTAHKGEKSYSKPKKEK